MNCGLNKTKKECVNAYRKSWLVTFSTLCFSVWVTSPSWTSLLPSCRSCATSRWIRISSTRFSRPSPRWPTQFCPEWRSIAGSRPLPTPWLLRSPLAPPLVSWRTTTRRNRRTRRLMRVLTTARSRDSRERRISRIWIPLRRFLNHSLIHQAMQRR